MPDEYSITDSEAPDFTNAQQYSFWLKTCKKTHHVTIRKNSNGIFEKVFKSFHGFDRKGKSEFAYFHVTKVSNRYYKILISTPMLSDDIVHDVRSNTGSGLTYEVCLNHLRWDGGRLKREIEKQLDGPHDAFPTEGI